jgi:hypothetical protein
MADEYSSSGTLRQEANDIADHETLNLRLTPSAAAILNEALTMYIESEDYSETTETRGLRWAVQQMVEDFPVETGSSDTPEAEASGP